VQVSCLQVICLQIILVEALQNARCP
jgi:hypothetical protein